MSGIRNKPLLLLITFGDWTHDFVGKNAIQEHDTDHIHISVFDITVIMNKTVNFFTVYNSQTHINCLCRIQ